MFERSRFFNGQRLVAPDLQGIDDFQREMRWLHNRSLHQPGVASGYAVTGAKGDREIKVDPGYAIDCLGREIVLTLPRAEPIPPVANDGNGDPVLYDLTVSYPQELETVELREGVCDPGGVKGAVRQRETPVFCWVRVDSADSKPLVDEIESGLRIRLGRAEILNCQLNKPLSLAQRSNAKPSCQPYVACGSTSGKWDIKATMPFGITLKPSVTGHVDTRAAGFRVEPGYFANLIGTRSIDIGTGAAPFLIDGFVTIAKPTPTGFESSVLVPALLFARQEVVLSAGPGAGNLTGVVDAVVTALNDLQDKGQFDWRIEWMGVEP